MTDPGGRNVANQKERHTELLEHLRRRDMNKERFEEPAQARMLVGDIGAYDCLVVPITNDGQLCPFMVGRVHSSLPVPTLELEAAGLRRFGKKYAFIAVCSRDGVITDEALYAALSGGLMEASTEGVELVAVPALGVTGDHLATMEAAVRSFQDLTEVIGIHMPRVVFVSCGNEPSKA